jgi:hypothetical protein
MLSGCWAITKDNYEIVTSDYSTIDSHISDVDELVTVAHPNCHMLPENAGKSLFLSKSNEIASICSYDSGQRATRECSPSIYKNEESQSEGHKSPIYKARRRFRSNANEVEEVKKMLIAVVREEIFSMR